MGQQCCQAAFDDDSIALKALIIKQDQYQQLQNYQFNDPFINQRIQNLQQQHVFKHKQLNKFFFGEWDTGYATGKGSMYIPGTIFYKGQFSNGVPDQQGKIQYLNRDEFYQGQFLNGKASGKGRYKNDIKKIIFQGMWLNSFPQNGTLTFEDNQNIKIIHFDDYKQGDAVIQYKDGRQYKGKISTQNFIPQGKGRITFKDKSFYDGQWHHGLMHGQGVYEWPDGSSYLGSYSNGKKEGFGVFRYSSGKRYEGNWANGKQQGYGKMIIGQNQEEEKIGIWKQGKFLKADNFNRDQNVKKKQKQSNLLEQKREILNKNENVFRKQNAQQSQKEQIGNHLRQVKN